MSGRAKKGAIRAPQTNGRSVTAYVAPGYTGKTTHAVADDVAPRKRGARARLDARAYAPGIMASSPPTPVLTESQCAALYRWIGTAQDPMTSDAPAAAAWRRETTAQTTNMSFAAWVAESFINSRQPWIDVT